MQRRILKLGAIKLLKRYFIRSAAIARKHLRATFVAIITKVKGRQQWPRQKSTLIERYKPTIVIVQLGTNWIDQSLSDDYIRHVLARFVSAVHSDGTPEDDLDRAAGFIAVFKGAKPDLPVDPTIRATG